MSKFDIVVIGTSAGGLGALQQILGNLDRQIKTPIVIVQHLSSDSGDSIFNLLKKYSTIEMFEPVDKQPILENHIYLAPADYHLLIEKDKTFSLNLDPKENFCRPSIDVLFETAAEVYFEKTLGVILTGANIDGTKGCIKIKKFLGQIIAQDPDEAVISVMPLGAINSGTADYVLSLKNIAIYLNRVLKE